MAEEFIGLRVRVSLADGRSVEGRIQSVAEAANLLLLSDAGKLIFSVPNHNHACTPSGGKWTRVS